MQEHVVAYRSEACESMLQLIVKSMGEHVSILICNLPSWFTLRSLAFIQDASVLYYIAYMFCKGLNCYE